MEGEMAMWRENDQTEGRRVRVMRALPSAASWRGQSSTNGVSRGLRLASRARVKQAYRHVGCVWLSVCSAAGRRKVLLQQQ